MKKSKGLAVVLTAVFLVGSLLTGCGKSGEEATAVPTGGGQATEGAATDAGKAEGDTFGKKLTLNLGMFDVTDLDDELSAFVEQKFNVELKLTQVSWDSWAEQVNLLTASGDMPDLLVYDMKPENYGQYKKFVNEGVIRDVPVLDGTYPNLAKLRDSMPVIEPWKIDGKLYAWPKPRGENPYNLNSTQVIVYRQDWAKKLGMDQAEFTAEQVYKLAKVMKEQDPGGNGAGKTVGYGDVGWGFGYLANAFSNTPDYMKVDGKYIWTQALPEKLEGVKFLHKMYQDGVYWKDFFTAKDNDSRSLFVSGLMGVYEDNLGISSYNKLKQDFVAANPGMNPDEAFKIMTVKGTDGKMFNAEWDNYWSASLFSAKVDDEKMARLLAIMDWAVSDEGEKYFFYGMKGKDWDEADGKIEVKWPRDENGKAKAPTYNGIQLRTIAALNGDFQAVNPDVADSTKSEVLDTLKNQTEANTNLNKLDYDYAYFSGPNKDKYGNFATEKEEALKKIVVSSKDVEKDWNAWLKSMEPKVQKVLDELNGAGQ